MRRPVYVYDDRESIHPTPAARNIWHLMEQAGGWKPFTTRQLKETLGISQATVERACALLQRGGHVVKRETSLGRHGKRCLWTLQLTSRDDVFWAGSIPSFDLGSIPSFSFSIPSLPSRRLPVTREGMEQMRGWNSEAIPPLSCDNESIRSVSGGSRSLTSTSVQGSEKPKETQKKTHARGSRAGAHPKSLATRWTSAYDETLGQTNPDYEIESIFEAYTKLLAEEGFEQPRYDNKIKATLQGWMLELDDRRQIEDAVAQLFHVWPNGSRVCNDPANPVLFEQDLNDVLASDFRLRPNDIRHPVTMWMEKGHERMTDEQPKESPAVTTDNPTNNERVDPLAEMRAWLAGQEERRAALAEKNSERLARFDAQRARADRKLAALDD